MRTNASHIAEARLKFFMQLYEVEREVRGLVADQRLLIRKALARPVADALHDWMRLQRQKITAGSATAKALDYSLKRWVALTRYLDDAQLPIGEARGLSPQERLAMRQERAEPLCEEMHAWLQLERSKVPDGSAVARAIDYSLNRWVALTQYLQDGDVPIDNNHCENQIRPWALERRNWLFAGSELAGMCVAVIMSLLQSALCRARHSAESL